MGDNIGKKQYVVKGNPAPGHFFPDSSGEADLGRFAAPGNPDPGSILPDGRVADLPRFASPGNPDSYKSI